MDRATLLGFLAAVGVTYYCMWDGAEGNMATYWHFSALILVLFGCLACTCMSMSLPTFVDGWRVVRKVLFCKDPSLEFVVERVVHFSTVARSQGLLAMETDVNQLDDPFLANGLRMIIDGQKPEDIELKLRLQIHGMTARHKAGRKMFQVMGLYAPAFGLLTTLMGQVVMFKNMGSDIQAIGSGMAVALLGTLYGSLFSNLICLPFADKLDSRSHEERLIKEMCLQGVLAIANEDAPAVVKQKLMAFLDGRTQQRAAGV